MNLEDNGKELNDNFVKLAQNLMLKPISPSSETNDTVGIDSRASNDKPKTSPTSLNNTNTQISIEVSNLNFSSTNSFKDSPEKKSNSSESDDFSILFNSALENYKNI